MFSNIIDIFFLALMVTCFVFTMAFAIIHLADQPDIRAADEVVIVSINSDTLFHKIGDIRVWEGECTLVTWKEGEELIRKTFCNSISIVHRTRK